MSNQRFTMVENSAAEVPKLLMQEASEFENSEEYHRLDDEDKKSVGIFCGAFANYISRVYGEEKDSAVLDRAFNAIESLSSTKDSDIENLVVTEILENLRFDEYPELTKKLGRNSKALYERWLT